MLTLEAIAQPLPTRRSYVFNTCTWPVEVYFVDDPTKKHLDSLLPNLDVHTSFFHNLPFAPSDRTMQPSGILVLMICTVASLLLMGTTALSGIGALSVLQKMATFILLITERLHHSLRIFRINCRDFAMILMLAVDGLERVEGERVRNTGFTMPLSQWAFTSIEFP